MNSPHTWRIESRHQTSDGLVAYQHCPCGARRVTLGDPGIGISAELRGDGHRFAATA